MTKQEKAARELARHSDPTQSKKFTTLFDSPRLPSGLDALPDTSLVRNAERRYMELAEDQRLVATGKMKLVAMQKKVRSVRDIAGRIAIDLAEQDALPGIRPLLGWVQGRIPDLVGQMAWVWVITWLRQLRPNAFEQRDHEPIFKMDEAGRILGHDGKPIPDLVSGEPALVMHDWDYDDWLHDARNRANLNSMGCRVMADLLKDHIKVRLEATHSPCFTSVKWYGTHYQFSKGNQAESVQLLWEAWEGGGHSVSQETIEKKVSPNTSRFRLSHVFRRKKSGGGYDRHPAWGTMIQEASKGCYKLVPPDSV